MLRLVFVHIAARGGFCIFQQTKNGRLLYFIGFLQCDNNSGSLVMIDAGHDLAVSTLTDIWVSEESQNGHRVTKRNVRKYLIEYINRTEVTYKWKEDSHNIRSSTSALSILNVGNNPAHDMGDPTIDSSHPLIGKSQIMFHLVHI